MSHYAAGERQAIEILLEHQLNLKVKSLSSLEGGANSRPYQVTVQGGQHYFAKFYPVYTGDTRDRLATEYQSLKFLWENGLRHIPRPLAWEPTSRLAIYEFIEGRLYQAEEINESIIREAMSVLKEMQAHRTAPSPWKIPPASEACFCLEDYVKNLNQRLTFLQAVQNQNLQDFLAESLVPLWRRAQEGVLSSCSAKERARTLVAAERVLSPSDVGFHNILFDEKNSRSVLVDFEYFGWDDPVKMLCDFLLQPEHPIPISQRPYAGRLFCQIFRQDPEIPARFTQIFPLIGMRWCCIILNGFLKSGEPSLLDRQLQKASLKAKQVADLMESREYTTWVS